MCVSEAVVPHLRLHHVCAMKPQIEHNAVDVHRVSGVQLLKDSVQSDEGPGAAHSSTVRQKHNETLTLPAFSIYLILNVIKPFVNVNDESANKWSYCPPKRKKQF